MKKSFENALKIDIIVSFLMESGVKLLRQELALIKERDIPVRILTGSYLNITQPQPLYLLKDVLGDKADIRFYHVKNKSFHPKAYIFHYKDEGEIFLGSSNMSYSALTEGIEWNYRITKSKNPEDFQSFMNIFENLFLNKSLIIGDKELRSYADNWIRPSVYKDIDKVRKSSENAEEGILCLYEPKGVQIEVLHYLKETREEGFDKGLVVAATGIGKTYLSAFDSKDFNKILFVAHREEILKQAERAFKNVNTHKKTGFL
ncbi:DEAD/DEAH box helicase family protein [Clostridium polynesiense]|uniref:DEAD/DEAH box helicase family protein n=1 Tax=Clostridium polynesiense TaxID=1325933 RepID=UPI0005915A36|nr:DEAD/DEAH box helicase family protein [Clostridium polynesiense]